MNTKYSGEIVKEITRMSGNYSGYELFSDWVKALALSISNTTDMIHGKTWKNREQQYMDIVKKHGETLKSFVKLTSLLMLALETSPRDILGEVYMSAGLGSKQTGQFFTPYHLSVMCAETTVPKNISEENPFIINEPSCGGGGMIIAASSVLRNRGLNPQRCMEVVAQDLDWKGVYMTYVQLSLLGIKAIVVQGDTLADPFENIKKYPKERVLVTPAKKGVLL